MSKFIQIAAMPAGHNHSALYALDDEGRVWFYVYASSKGSYWSLLPGMDVRDG